MVAAFFSWKLKENKYSKFGTNLDTSSSVEYDMKSTLMRGFQKYGRNWIFTVAFWGQTKAVQKCAARWGELAVLFCSSKSHLENSISFIFLEFPHQVDMKNVVKSSQTLFWVFQYSRNSNCASLIWIVNQMHEYAPRSMI